MRGTHLSYPPDVAQVLPHPQPSRGRSPVPVMCPEPVSWPPLLENTGTAAVLTGSHGLFSTYYVLGATLDLGCSYEKVMGDSSSGGEWACVPRWVSRPFRVPGRA